MLNGESRHSQALPPGAVPSGERPPPAALQSARECTEPTPSARCRLAAVAAGRPLALARTQHQFAGNMRRRRLDDALTGRISLSLSLDIAKPDRSNAHRSLVNARAGQL